MFWGLIMEPKRRYTQVVKHPFHVSMAALDVFSADDEPTQLMLYFEERNYLLCTLQKGQTVQCPLDLNFETGDEVVFATNGNCNIHLSGYLQDQLDNFDEELEEEEEEVEEEVKKVTQKKKQNAQKNETQPPSKKSKLSSLLQEEYDSNDEDDESFVVSEATDGDSDDDIDEEEDDEDEDMEENESDDDEEEEEDDEEEEEELPKPKMNGEKAKKNKKQNEIVQNKEKPSKSKNEIASPKQENKKQANKQSPQQKRTIEGGVMVQDLNVGDGAIAKPGKVVQVYYEGRLKQNNKLFDQTNKGSGFKFRLGKQEVIKAWDVGVVGMKVGGRRRITCPPAMAYGQKGSPPAIPPNSTLVFEVELKNVV